MSDEKVVDLDKYRLKLDLESPPIAFLEAVWGNQVFGFNAVVRDLEDLRRGGDGGELDNPRTHYEVVLLVKHTRALANDIARRFGLEELINEEDDLP